MLIRLTPLSSYWTPPEYWDADDIALEMSNNPNIWTDGNRKDFSSVGGFEVAGAGVYLPAAEVVFERSVWGVAEEYGDARPGVLQTVQRAEFWVPFLLCRPIGLAIWVLITSMLLGLLVGCWIGQSC